VGSGGDVRVDDVLTTNAVSVVAGRQLPALDVRLETSQQHPEAIKAKDIHRACLVDVIG